MALARGLDLAHKLQIPKLEIQLDNLAFVQVLQNNATDKPLPREDHEAKLGYQGVSCVPSGQSCGRLACQSRGSTRCLY